MPSTGRVVVISSNIDTIVHLCRGSRHGQQTNMTLQSLWRRSLNQKEKRKNQKMKNKNRVDEEWCVRQDKAGFEEFMVVIG